MYLIRLKSEAGAFLIIHSNQHGTKRGYTSYLFIPSHPGSIISYHFRTFTQPLKHVVKEKLKKRPNEVLPRKIGLSNTLFPVQQISV